MKKNLKMMVKKVAEVACIVGLTLAVNGVVDSANDVQVQPVANAQEVNKELIAEEVQPMGTMISKDNWLNDENDENKDLTGNVIIEDSNRTIEITKEVYDEIEYGENSDLDGDIYIEEDDIVNELYHQVKSTEDFRNNFSKFNVVDSKNDGDKYRLTLDNGLELIYLVDLDMFYVYNIDGNIKEFECMNDTKDYLDSIAVNDTVNDTVDSEVVNTDTDDVEVEIDEDDEEYTEDNYNDYLEYKEGLIEEHGEEVYELMNQEAGITTEEESFNHYMEYGI